MTGYICLFEDNKAEDFLPLVYFRPVYDLRCGILTLKEKVEKYLSTDKIMLHCRPFLGETVSQNNSGEKVNSLPGGEIIFINGRAVLNEYLADKIKDLTPNSAIISGSQLFAARLDSLNSEIFFNSLPETDGYKNIPGIKLTEDDIKLAEYPWDLVSRNGEEIKSDYKLLTKDIKNPKYKNILEHTSLINPENIFIGEGSVIHPFVLLDASDGPIYIGKNATVMSHTTIQGPCFIGDNSSIKIGAKIYHECSIGEVCKVGGEIENSIIHSYSNKQHDGFLGHSYLGSWVNLGAGTNNSDLKNNYENIKIIINGKKTDTGLQFVGLIMGDHSKTAIGTTFNTGTVCGVSCNIFGAGFPRTYIPSFSWGGASGFVTYKLDKCLEVAKKVMSRRKIEMTAKDEELFGSIFEMTSSERKN